MVGARKQAIRSALLEAQEALRAALDGVGADAWSRPSRNDGWTVHSLLTHVATAEAGLLALLQRMASGQGGAVADFDPDRWNAGQLRRRGATPPPQLRQELEAAHTTMLALLDGLDEAALDQRGHLTTGGDGSLEDAFRLVARHKLSHTRDIEAALAT